jgi:putative oxidoreductase
MATIGHRHSAAIDTGIAILRVVVGLVFLMHGVQKVFQFGFAGVTGAFSQMGVPLPGIAGPFVAILELLGGLALIIGLLTRPIAMLLAAEMVVAVVLVHLRSGFFLPNGFEFALTLAAASLALALTGPGALSVDALIAGRRKPQPAGATGV